MLLHNAQICTTVVRITFEAKSLEVKYNQAKILMDDTFFIKNPTISHSFLLHKNQMKI